MCGMVEEQISKPVLRGPLDRPTMRHNYLHTILLYIRELENKVQFGSQPFSQPTNFIIQTNTYSKQPIAAGMVLGCENDYQELVQNVTQFYKRGDIFKILYDFLGFKSPKQNNTEQTYQKIYNILIHFHLMIWPAISVML